MTYAKERAVGAIHELPLRQNEAFMAFLRKSYFFNYEQLLSYSLPIEELDVAALRAATSNSSLGREYSGFQMTTV
jgi:hypothetical protein